MIRGRRSGPKEPTGEAETLWGKIDPKVMGDRVQRERPPGGKDAAGPGAGRQSKRRKAGAAAAEAGLQLPEVQRALEWLSGLVQGLLGDCPHDVLQEAVAEVLSVLRSPEIVEFTEKVGLIEQLLGSLSTEQQAQLQVVWEKLQAAAPEARAGAEEDMNTDLGVAVQFEDSEDEEGDGDDLLHSDEEEPDDEDKDGAPAAPGAAGGAGGQEQVVAGAAVVNAAEIDRTWLQRLVGKALGGSAGGSVTEEILQVLLRDDTDEVELENELAEIVQYSDADLIKSLMQNRLKIAWCTILARADGDEKAKIEKEMATRPELLSILQELGRGGGHMEVDAARGAARRDYDLVPLETYVLKEGSHTLSNTQTKLPEGTMKTVTKEYEEIYTPPVKPAGASAGPEKPIADLPEWMHPAFPGMKALNKVQTRVSDTALYSPHNMLICAPTGAGKTNIAVLTILREVMNHRDDASGRVDKAAFKCVYIAPMRALVTEVVGNLNKRFNALGLRASEFTGEAHLSKKELAETNIIVATPEKWDIVTRRNGQASINDVVKLMILDEVHMLHDERGPVIESLVARAIHHTESKGKHLRILGLSATLPNYQDVATFLRVEPDKGLFFFDGSYRPCPLAQHFIGVTINKPLQRLKAMDDICYDKTIEVAGKSQIIIFVHSRRETVRTAQFLRDRALQEDRLRQFLREGTASYEIIQQESESCKSMELQDLLKYGFAVHHAGLSRADRMLVEDLFADGHIQVLVSTATLAWGVNLPAHTVMIKGTQVYNPAKGSWTELSPLDIMQMVGRAGRPQFDDSGVGILITTYGELQFYLSVLNQQLPIESQLMSCLPDSLNAEIVSGVVSDVESGVLWLMNTYMYVCMLRNPAMYGSSAASLKADPAQERACGNLIHSAATVLHQHGLVAYNRRTGQIQATELGNTAAKYYVSYTTIATFNRTLKPSAREIELCKAFSSSAEFENILVRQEEKIELSKLLDRAPIPIKESVEEPAAKINVLLQSYISSLALDGFVLYADLGYIKNNGVRLMRCILDIVALHGWAEPFKRTLNMCKMVARQLWNSQSNFRQFPTIPQEVITSLEKKDIAWDRFYDMSPHEIGECARNPRLGKALHALVHQFPRLELSASVQPVSRSLLNMHVTVQADFAWEEEVHGTVQRFWLLVEDSESSKILTKLLFTLRKFQLDSRLRFTFCVPVFEPLPPQYFVHVISDDWLNCETTLPVSFRHLILPSKTHPPTELMDLQPLPVAALGVQALVELFPGTEAFNAIQTQAFDCLFKGSESALVCAPAKSGKLLCAEFALMRSLLEKGEGLRCIVMAVDGLSAWHSWEHLAARYGPLGLKVLLLEGDNKKDLKAARTGNIVVGTPAHIDSLTLRWRSRKLVEKLDLLIVDGLHYLGDEKVGPHIEVVVSRVRYAAHETGQAPRIVGLSACLANGHDVGMWMGASAKSIFNFHPSTRLFPVELQFQVVSESDYFQSVHQMATAATYQSQQLVQDDICGIVFAPNQHFVVMVAAEYLLPAFNAQFDEGGAKAGPPVDDPTLRKCLKAGIGFLHKTLAADDAAAVEALFAAGELRVLLVSQAICRVLGDQIKSSNIIILHPQHLDEQAQSFGGSNTSEVMFMTAFAAMSGKRNLGSVRIICHEYSKNQLKAMMGVPYMLESHLQNCLHTHLCSEVVAKTIQTKQDAVDYLTWSYFYRRLSQNPNYYNLRGVSHQHISEHLSDLIEEAVGELEAARCISVEDEMDLVPLNLAMICTHHVISYISAELFSSLLSAKTKKQALIAMLSNAHEFTLMPLHSEEHDDIYFMLKASPIAPKEIENVDSNTKAAALLHSHIFRKDISSAYRLEQLAVARGAWKLTLALVDIIASSGWLRPLLEAMELAQVIAQRIWDEQSWLLQIRGVDPDMAQALEDAGIESVADFAEAAEADLLKVLGLPAPQVQEMQAYAQAFPVMSAQFDLTEYERVAPGTSVPVEVTIQHNVPKEGAKLLTGPVQSNLWWLLIGDYKRNELLAIKQITQMGDFKNVLEIEAPEEPGTYKYNLYVISSSKMGCDQEFEFEITVEPDGR